MKIVGAHFRSRKRVQAIPVVPPIVEADKHNWGDVIAGAVIGWAASEITTVRYYPPIRVMPGFGETPFGFTMTAMW